MIPINDLSKRRWLATGTNAKGRLVVTSDESGAGHLQQGAIADTVLCIHALESLVRGPVPASTDAAGFYRDRDALYASDPRLQAEQCDWLTADQAIPEWRGLVAACEAHDRVELWIDPEPNDQLHLVRALSWLRAFPHVIEKVSLAHLDDRLGERSPGDFRTGRQVTRALTATDMRLANDAWDAYRQPTPEAWAALLRRDLAAFPHLARAVRRLLDELPAIDTALGATQWRVLERIAGGERDVRGLLAWNAQGDPARTFGYWDFGRLLCELAACESPAIAGLDERTFDDAMHQDVERHARFSHSELTLTTLGEALVARRDDFTRHNAIHRWWGGTLLTNDALWRWDAADERLVRPR